MNLGRKLSTLIKARLRGTGPLKRGRRYPPAADPAGRLEEIRRALAEVEARERVVAEQLKVSETRASDAAAQGDEQIARQQRRLANELRAHLETQSAQAIQLQEKLTALEEVRREAQGRLESAEVVERQAAQAGQSGAPATASTESGGDAGEDDPDLSDRKSRLSV